MRGNFDEWTEYVCSQCHRWDHGIDLWGGWRNYSVCEQRGLERLGWFWVSQSKLFYRLYACIHDFNGHFLMFIMELTSGLLLLNFTRVAFFIGVIFSSIMASTLQGAVKGVLICYVDHPGKMHEIHPNDTKVLVDAIALVFPNVREFRFAADTFMV